MSKHLVFTHSATEAEVLHSSLVLLGRVPWCWLLGSGCSTIAWTLNPKLAASQRSGVKRRSCCSRARLRGPKLTHPANFHRKMVAWLRSRSGAAPTPMEMETVSAGVRELRPGKKPRAEAAGAALSVA